MKVKLLYIIIPIIIILILTFILFRRSSPSSSPPPSTKNSSLPLSYPLQALTGPQIGRQIFATINVGGNNYSVLVDTGSTALNLQNYKPGQYSSKSNLQDKYDVYGGLQIVLTNVKIGQNNLIHLINIWNV